MSSGPLSIELNMDDGLEPISKSFENPTSLEVVKHHHLYPLPEAILDDDTSIPTDLLVLPGEGISFVGQTAYGLIILSNYRVFIMEKDKVVARIPKNAIMKTESMDLLRVKVTCKTGSSFVLAFDDHLTALRWMDRLTIQAPSKLDSLVACHFHAHIKENNIPFAKCDCPKNIELYDEFMRMKFDEKVWQITDVNKLFQICPTYPEFHIIPRSITDSNLKAIAGFRSLHRFPSVVWRSVETGAVLLRCAQPCVGIMSWRSMEDEKFVRAVRNSCTQNSPSESDKRLLIVDARNYGAAQLNRIKGGGFEFVEYYDRTDITFMSLPNIHAVRDSFERLISLYSVKSDLSWFATLEKTNWLQNLSLVIKSALEIVQALHHHGRPVMVHCTDGWDRTPQLTSLTQLLLDPYYRSFKGFRILVEREWLSFGHKFGDRCGHSVNAHSPDERSPIFLQWLDCVYQLTQQFPKAFEFNEAYLVKLCVHVYSTMFGTFLCNSMKERMDERLQERTCCLWTFLSESTNAWQYGNYLYDSKANQVLFPSFLLRDLIVWKTIYVNTFCPQFSHLSTDIEASNSTVVNGGSDAVVLNASLNGAGGVTSNGAPLRRSHSTDDIYSSLNNATTAPNNGNVDSRSDENSPPLLCSNSPGVQYRESSVPVTSSVSLREIDQALPNNDMSNNPSNLIMPTTVNCEQFPVDDLHPSPTNENCSNSSTVNHTMDCVGQLASSTDTLTEAVQLPLFDTVSPGVQSTAVAQLSASNSIEEECDNSVSGGEESDHQSLSNPSELSPVYMNSSVCDPLNIETNGHPSVYYQEMNPNETVPCDTKATNNNMELPRSLGYGTSSDFSTPYSSGPSTPDNVDQTPSWHQTYFRRATGHSVSSSGSDSTSDNNTITRKAIPSTLGGGMSESHYDTVTADSSKLSLTHELALCGSPTATETIYDAEQDEDGLSHYVDHVTRHIHDMARYFQQEKATLERKIDRVTRELKRSIANNRIHQQQMNSLCGTADTSDGGHSLDRISNISASSDASSFDLIDETESHIVRWVPDQHAHSCHLCSKLFNWNIRKHHCRKCGNVFCDICSNFFIPVPDQMCHEPTRVCKTCYLNATVDLSPVTTNTIEYSANQAMSRSSSTSSSTCSQSNASCNGGLTATNQASARA